MQSKEKVFDDIARMAGGAVSVMSGITRQMREEIRARVDEFATRMDLVPREEFERLEAMISEARREQAKLLKRIENLEGKKPAKAAPQKSKAKPSKTKSRK